jgi:hypothetical protein
MRRYVITCEFCRAKRAAAIGDCIRKISDEWEHPLIGVWLVTTTLSARDIRSSLLAHLDFQDRIFICEAGSETAEFNALPTIGGKVTQIEHARTKSSLLTGIFSRSGQSSRHLRGATPKSLRSA